MRNVNGHVICYLQNLLQARVCEIKQQNKCTAVEIPFILVLCSIHRYNDVLSQRFDDTSIDIVARVKQWTAINLNTRTPFKMFNCLIWPQRNTTGLTDIKRRNRRNRASHLRNMEISAKCDNYG